MVPTFLPEPAAIRRALQDAIAKASKLDLAVAFVGRDWQEILGAVDVPIRVVCWLSSTNTNPFAVRQMKDKPQVRVRQMDRMHAKVYLARGADVAIVGSANLSASALALGDIAGQGEAAVLVRGEEQVRPIAAWFDDVWTSARRIRTSDLARAETAWKAARDGLGRRGHAGRNSKRAQRETLIPAAWKPPRTLRQLADRVRGLDLEELAYLRGLTPHNLSASKKELIFNRLSEWAKHPGAFRPFLSVSREESRRAFEVALDLGRPIEERLEALAPKGRSKVAGLGLTAWTMVLYWWCPEMYPPFNDWTKLFVRSFGFQRLLPKSLTPHGYARWIQFAQDLSERLHLPTAGHVDRLVWEQTTTEP